MQRPEISGCSWGAGDQPAQALVQAAGLLVMVASSVCHELIAHGRQKPPRTYNIEQFSPPGGKDT
jgi:hypothetical protein